MRPDHTMVDIQADVAHHYGVTVSDVDEAVEFYRDTLGLEEVRRVERGPDSADGRRFSRLVGVGDTETKNVHLQAEGCIVELIEYVEPPGEDLNSGAEANDIGAAHFCFEVEDIDGIYEELSDEIDFETEPVTFSSGVKAVYLYDPDDNIVEFIDFAGAADD